MKHLIPLTPKQLQIVQASLQLSLKYADSQYIDNVNEIMREIEDLPDLEEIYEDRTQRNRTTVSN